eukprot:2339139-Pyramimonas_sp.AAC.1
MPMRVPPASVMAIAIPWADGQKSAERAKQSWHVCRLAHSTAELRVLAHAGGKTSASHANDA